MCCLFYCKRGIILSHHQSVSRSSSRMSSSRISCLNFSSCLKMYSNRSHRLESQSVFPLAACNMVDGHLATTIILSHCKTTVVLFAMCSRNLKVYRITVTIRNIYEGVRVLQCKSQIFE